MNNEKERKELDEWPIDQTEIDIETTLAERKRIILKYLPGSVDRKEKLTDIEKKLKEITGMFTHYRFDYLFERVRLFQEINKKNIYLNDIKKILPKKLVVKPKPKKKNKKAKKDEVALILLQLSRGSSSEFEISFRNFIGLVKKNNSLNRDCETRYMTDISLSVINDEFQKETYKVNLFNTYFKKWYLENESDIHNSLLFFLNDDLHLSYFKHKIKRTHSYQLRFLFEESTIKKNCNIYRSDDDMREYEVKCVSEVFGKEDLYNEVMSYF